MPGWIEFNVSAPVENSEVIAQVLLDAGCEGVQIDDTNIAPEGEDAVLTPKVRAMVTGYVEDKARPDVMRAEIEAALQRGGWDAQLDAKFLDARDWATVWRENFPPLLIGGFWIVPSWVEWDIEWPTERVIRLDPGLAFGTGQHPTTSLCLEFISEELPKLPSPTLLDIGCGSGILSVAAARLGAQVTGSDLDPNCIRATRENAAINEVAVEAVEAPDLNWVKQPFDVVAANLMSQLLIRLAPDIARVTRSGGLLITSGISQPRAEEVEAALHAQGFETLARRDAAGEQRGEYVEWWSGFLLRRKADG